MMRWLKDHALLLLLIAVAVTGFILAVLAFRKDRGSVKDLVNELKLEKKVIDEKAKVAKLKAKEGHVAAAAEIQKEHEETIKKMDEADKQKVRELSNDPEALVDHLIRISS